MDFQDKHSEAIEMIYFEVCAYLYALLNLSSFSKASHSSALQFTLYKSS
jgi:hypothetical protein